MTTTKAYIVFDEKTKKILYEGNLPFKAQQIMHLKAGVNIQFSTQITAAMYQYVVAMSQRYN